MQRRQLVSCPLPWLFRIFQHQACNSITKHVCAVYFSPVPKNDSKFFSYLNSKHIWTHSPFAAISIPEVFNAHHRVWLSSPFTDQPDGPASNFPLLNDLQELSRFLLTRIPDCLGDMQNTPGLFLTFNSSAYSLHGVIISLWLRIRGQSAGSLASCSTVLLADRYMGTSRNLRKVSYCSPDASPTQCRVNGFPLTTGSNGQRTWDEYSHQAHLYRMIQPFSLSTVTI